MEQKKEFMHDKWPLMPSRNRRPNMMDNYDIMILGDSDHMEDGYKYQVRSLNSMRDRAKTSKELLKETTLNPLTWFLYSPRKIEMK